jgi:hypothetical protein
MTDPKEYERRRQEAFAKIVKGQTDIAGNIVHDVYTKADEFAIFSSSPSGSIAGMHVLIETEDPHNKTLIKNFQQVKGELDKLKAISSRANDSSFSARIAHALAVAIEGEPEQAKQIFKEIESDINRKYFERVIGKLVYMTGAFVVAIVFSAASIYLYIAQPTYIVHDRPVFYELVLTGGLATLGGLISVSRKLNQLDIDKGLGYLPYFLYGVERNIYSIVGAVFIFVLIRSNLLFGFVSDLENQMYGIMAFGFLAGFSETLVPNALAKLEKKADESNN